jgi:hypothetical protein
MKLNSTSLKSITATVIIVLMVGACNYSGTPTATPNVATTPLPVPPTPALEPAEDYVIGASHIPHGMVLFVEANTFDECSLGKCGCPVVEPPRQAYKWNSKGDLCVEEDFYEQFFPDPTSTVSSTSFQGLFGHGEWLEDLSPIHTLPYNEYGINILSINSDGVIVVDIQGKAYDLKPGQSWVASGSYISYKEKGCSLSYETRFTNFGLLKRQQIRLEDSRCWLE